MKLGVYPQRRKHLKGGFGGLMSLCYIIQVRTSHHCDIYLTPVTGLFTKMLNNIKKVVTRDQTDT